MSETRTLVKELVRLVRDDVTELRDAVVEIDERAAGVVARLDRHLTILESFHRRISSLEAIAAEAARLPDDSDDYSRHV